jgi:hypothetical protein
MIDPMILPIIALGLPVILVPIVMGIRHARIERELEHAERMKALEQGRTLPGDEPWWSPARVCVAIGAGVPVGTFGIAFLANDTNAWIAAGLVGGAGVVGGTILAYRYFTQYFQAKSREHIDLAKPFVDHDAYDVVSQRSGSYQTQSQSF